jgi:hypothetical protein
MEKNQDDNNREMDIPIVHRRVTSLQSKTAGQ